MDYLLAQVNVARMREPLDSPLLAEFVAALDPVNAAADAATGSSGWRRPTSRCGGYRAVICGRLVRPRNG